MAVITYKFSQFVVNSFIFHPEKWNDLGQKITQKITQKIKSLFSIDLLFPIRQFLRNIKINDPKFAHQLCDIIPSQCPFERDLKIFGKVLFHIPPMCKLNPFYDDLVELRFRAQCYLVDECGEEL